MRKYNLEQSQTWYNLPLWTSLDRLSPWTPYIFEQKY